jgi:hypothetical protein
VGAVEVVVGLVLLAAGVAQASGAGLLACFAAPPDPRDPRDPGDPGDPGEGGAPSGQRHPPGGQQDPIRRTHHRHRNPACTNTHMVPAWDEVSAFCESGFGSVIDMP